MRAQSVTSVTDENLTTKTVVIANGATGLSGEVDLQGYKLVAIHMPATWVTANLTLLTAPTSGGTFNKVTVNGTELVIPVSQGVCEVNDDAALAFATLRFLKFRSGTAATPVNQTADRTLTLILKG
jgi:hypothetical protein